MGHETQKKQKAWNGFPSVDFCRGVGRGNTDVEKPASYTISDLTQQQNNTKRVYGPA